MPLRPASGDARKLELQKQEFRNKIATASNDEDDPLAIYDQFVQWTLKTYGENNPNSGLPELLDQATREFKEDPLYKTDLRYLKLWSLYARQVERSSAMAIYAYLVSNEIGTSYSVLYEEYATLLEADGRCAMHTYRLYNDKLYPDDKKQK
jgi:checkpoint serine/threonine-protein kinase